MTVQLEENKDLEIKKLKADVLFLQQVLAATIRKTPIVIRKDILQEIPEFELSENLSGEMIVRVK